MTRWTCALAAVALFAVAAAAGSPVEDSPGAAIYYACATCHGARGEADEARMTPAIAVLPAWYTVAQLRAYRNGWRGTESDDFTSRKMTLFAEALASEQALQAVAEYVAGLGDALRGSELSGVTQSPLTPADAVTLEHFAGCASCHGASGEGIEELGGPPIAGQPVWYLKRQMDAFSRGARGSHPDDRFGGQMRVAATPSDPDEFVALIRYIASLPRP